MAFSVTVWALLLATLLSPVMFRRALAGKEMGAATLRGEREGGRGEGVRRRGVRVERGESCVDEG